MNRFVEECRREWRRLGVPEAVANEMAAELDADLTEAQADGAAPEEVLGSGVFDPRAFAAAWAEERGVIAAPVERRRRRVLPIALAFAALVVITLVGVALVLAPRPEIAARLAVGPFGRSSVAAPHVLRVPGPPGAHGRFTWRRGVVLLPSPVAQRVTLASPLMPVGWVLLVIGVGGMLAVGGWSLRQRLIA